MVQIRDSLLEATLLRFRCAPGGVSESVVRFQLHRTGSIGDGRIEHSQSFVEDSSVHMSVKEAGV